MLARIPPLLRVGIAGAVVIAVARTLLTMVPVAWLFGEWFGLTFDALSMPVALAMCAGTFELASRLTGRGRTAAIIAGYAAAIDLVVGLGDRDQRARALNRTCR